MRQYKALFPCGFLKQFNHITIICQGRASKTHDRLIETWKSCTCLYFTWSRYSIILQLNVQFDVVLMLSIDVVFDIYIVLNNIRLTMKQ